MRISLAVAAATLTSLAIAADATAAVECGVESRSPDGPRGDALVVTTTAFADAVALRATLETIEIADDRAVQPVTCLGEPPTPRSIDTVELATQVEETSLYLDLTEGPLAPGATVEDFDSRIELRIDWPFGFLGIGLGRRPDEIGFGELRGKTVGSFGIVPARDIEAPDLGNLLIRSGGGDDAIFLNGAIVGKPLETFGSLEAGAGADFLAGGARADILQGESGKDDLLSLNGGRDELDCGPGRDFAIADRRDEVVRCERVERSLDPSRWRR